MADNWYQGNAAQDGDQYRGWLLGHFIDPAAHGIRHTTDLEVKWGIHPAGQTRPAAGPPAKPEPHSSCSSPASGTKR